METKDRTLQDVGRDAYAAIAGMVAALECDYDRLSELRESRDDHDPDEHGLRAWAAVNPEEAEELDGLEAEAGDCEDQDDARRRIEEDALSVEVRSGWVAPGEWDTAAPEEFCLLLATGGPAVRIMGELDQWGEPCRAWLEVQDWFAPWTQYVDADGETLLSYARCFVFAVE